VNVIMNLDYPDRSGCPIYWTAGILLYNGCILRKYHQIASNIFWKYFFIKEYWKMMACNYNGASIKMYFDKIWY
jgi:hypothetical protein